LIEEDGRVAGVVTTSGERLQADVTLLAAGAWTSLLAPHLNDVMWPVAQPVFHLKPDDPAPWRPPRFTVWAAAIAETGWYGFPANADGIVKIANHGPGRRVPSRRSALDDPKRRGRARRVPPGNAPRARRGARSCASKTCLYCDSFDGDFWIGRDPDRPGFAVAAGDSGHGFKFAPVLGEVIADAIEEKSTRFTDRFAWRTPASRTAEQARWGLS
jgi:glycine/D-amino acid oxidase-like deaminating enzyme